MQPCPCVNHCSCTFHGSRYRGVLRSCIPSSMNVTDSHLTLFRVGRRRRGTLQHCVTFAQSKIPKYETMKSLRKLFLFEAQLENKYEGISGSDAMNLATLISRLAVGYENPPAAAPTFDTLTDLIRKSSPTFLGLPQYYEPPRTKKLQVRSSNLIPWIIYQLATHPSGQK